MSAIGRVTRAATEAQRTDRGENRIPAVWRARVVYIREAAADCGHRPGVYITVPNFTRGEIHGPVQVVGDTPAEGDLVVAVAVEGRKNDWIIITPSGIAEVEARLGAVETEVVQLDERLTSTHGETVNAIGILEAQMGVLDSIVEAHQLGSITWWHTSEMSIGSDGSATGRFQIEDYQPSGVSRAARLEVDIQLEGLASFNQFWVAPRVNGSHPFTPFVDIDSSGETWRFRKQYDFHIPAGASVDLTVALTGGSSSAAAGRIGFTRPQLTTPVIRSA